MAPRALDLAEIPCYHWQEHQHSQKDDYRSVPSNSGAEDSSHDSSEDDSESKPDYRWDEHPAADKRKGLRRANSDLTDYEPKVDKKRHLRKRPNKAKENGGKRDSLRRAHSDLTGLEPKVAKERKNQRRRPKKEVNDDDNEEEEEEEEGHIIEEVFSGSDGEEEENSAANKSKQNCTRRAKSDLTSYESKSTRDKRSAGNRRKKHPTVRFCTKEPQVEIRPSLSEEEKAEMFYTKMELSEMRREREEEKAEEARERRNKTYGDNSAKLGSIWGSSTNTVKPNKVVSKLHGDKPKEKTESEKKMENTFDALQLAMEQARMITGY